jgi:hypothetical protein
MDNESKSDRRQQSWRQRVVRVLIGLLAGYIAYVPALAIVDFLTNGRIDPAIFFYGLYLPFQFPLLLLEDFRDTLRSEEFVLQIIGVSMMIAGAFVGLKFRGSSKRLVALKLR